MKITMDIARRVLHFVRQGLTGGMGQGEVKGDMCVQHAVARAIGETGSDNPNAYEYEATDQPTCVHHYVRSLGIQLNDAGGWNTAKARGRGLQRFAIAQLGTSSNKYKLDLPKFEAEIKALAREFDVGLEDHVFNFSRLSQARLTKFANRVADVLEKMKTPGSEYLCMVDWPAKDLAKPIEDAEK